jgi:hypothetical protein
VDGPVDGVAAEIVRPPAPNATYGLRTGIVDALGAVYAHCRCPIAPIQSPG